MVDPTTFAARCDTLIPASANGGARMANDQRICGCIGCRNDATVIINHPRYGPRTTCDAHINNNEVVRRYD